MVRDASQAFSNGKFKGISGSISSIHMHARRQDLPKFSSSFAFCLFKTLSRSRLWSKFPFASTVTTPRTSKVWKELEDENIHTPKDMHSQFLCLSVHNTLVYGRTQSTLATQFIPFLPITPQSNWAMTQSRYIDVPFTQAFERGPSYPLDLSSAPFLIFTTLFNTSSSPRTCRYRKEWSEKNPRPAIGNLPSSGHLATTYTKFGLLQCGYLLSALPPRLMSPSACNRQSWQHSTW